MEDDKSVREEGGGRREVSERHISPSVTDARATVSHRYRERYSKPVLHRMTFLLIIHRG